ncbi:chemotaxis protein CheW [Belnapia sp. T6]|uniref:Chemotaxis protein CheW n=1 Tax=Belnapia mucosa TaxID=2804532 RepID=A0ABS1V3M0_9PROT|nr:chemotaxis protein CheW [Belnapia mucosa]MBL6455721.1 chemotaxis protein CheW [Belnapia mucosa]
MLVVFTLAGLRCAIRHADVRELLPLPRLWRAPTQPAPVAGFLNLAGEAVPVLDLARLFGLPDGEDDPGAGLYRHLILLRATPVALLVTRVQDLVSFAPERLRPVADKATLNGCVEAEFELAGGFVHLIAVDRLLLEEERQALLGLRAAAEARLEGWRAQPA